MPTIVEKQPAESFLYQFEYENALTSGETITDADAVTQASCNKVAGSEDLTIGSPSMHSTYILVRISGGTDNENYKLTSRVTTSLQNILELDALMHVRDE